MSNLIKSITVADTETLKLDPTRPHEVLIDSLGFVRMDVSLPQAEYKDWREAIPFLWKVLCSESFQTAVSKRNILDVADASVVAAQLETGRVHSFVYGLGGDGGAESRLIDALCNDNDVARYPELVKMSILPTCPAEGIVISYGDVHVNPLRQIVGGRKIDAKTLDFHMKNGYDPELVSNRVPFASAMAAYSAWTKGSDAVFFRGTDFDVPLINSCLIDTDIKALYKYNKPRDIRTAIDELSGTGDYVGYVDAKADWTLDTVGDRLILPDCTAMLSTTLGIQRKFDADRHSALIDAYLDLVSYLTFKYFTYVGVRLV